MKRFTRTGTAAAVFTATAVLIGAPSIDAAPPDGGGGDGTGDVYADLLVVYRDEDGVPILKEFEVPGEVEGETVIEYCVQPISPDPLPDTGTGPIEGVVHPVDGRTVYLVPLMGDDDAPAPPEGEEVEVCDPWPAYASYATEAELERLNMARAPEEFYQGKLDEVLVKLVDADEITLDGAGRITVDGVVIDAGPEQAAIYRSLMTTGTVPGLGAEPAEVAPFDTWMLAAAALGTASGKDTPISVDSVQYYNRIATDIPDEYVWNQVSFLGNDPADPEQFIDFGDFRYTRADVFPGCVTWLDVATLTWRVSPILDLAGFDPLPPVASAGTVANLAGFAQLADDVRRVIGVLHENDVIPGFYLDPVGENTCSEQADALDAPAISWDSLPADIIQTDGASGAWSVYMPWDGAAVADAQIRVTVDAADDFTAVDQMSVVDAVGSEPVTFALVEGNLVGTWPAAGFEIDPGDTITTTLDVAVGTGAPTGDYTMTLELIDLAVADPVEAVLATDEAHTTVHAAGLTALWTSEFDYTAQGVDQPVTLRIYNPDLGQDPTVGASVRLTVDAPEDFILASQVSAFSEAVPVEFRLDGGDLVGDWSLTDPLPVPFDESITWNLNIGEGAPLGIYRLTAEVVGPAGLLTDAAISEFVVGYEAGAPVVTITDRPAVVTNSTSATFAFESSVAATRFECQLDGGVLEPCSSPISYTGLADGVHTFAVATTVGGTAVMEWTVDTVAPELELVSAPAAKTSNGDATFEFTASGASSLLCGIDGAPLSACSSPATFDELSGGEHRFVVAAVDAAGNAASLGHTWRVTSVVSLVGPARLADTRRGWVADDGQFLANGPVRGGATIEVPVAGRAGVPADASAVMANLTIAGASADGYATAYECGTRPPTSSVNYQVGRNVANEVMVKLSRSGSICVFVSGTANVIVDAVGFVPDGSDYEVIRPARLTDTRPNAVRGGATIEVPVAGRAGVPADASAVMANLTIAGASADGYATAYECGTRPPTSSVNYQVGRNVANEVMVKLSRSGSICVFVSGTANVIVDAVGFV